MLPDFLVRDNAPFGRTKSLPLAIPQKVVESPPAPSSGNPPDAASCTSLSVSSVEVYVQSGIAQATRRAYRADLDHFAAWGGTIPATDDMVAAYIADHAAVLKVSTLTRRLAAISIAHGARRLPKPGRQSVGPGDDARHSPCSRSRSTSGQAPSSVRTSSSFSRRWPAGSRTCEIGLCC